MSVFVDDWLEAFLEEIIFVYKDYNSKFKKSFFKEQKMESFYEIYNLLKISKYFPKP